MPPPRPPLLRGAGARTRTLTRTQTCASIHHVYTRSNHNNAQPTAREQENAASWAAQSARIISGEKQSMLEILAERGFIKDIAGSPTALSALLTNKRTGAYAGIDPTAPSLHLGHLLPFMVLFWLHIHGHHTVSLIGGATAKIGDPTGRLSDRQAMDTSTRLNNLTAMHMQVRQLWKNVGVLANNRGFQKQGWRRDVWNNSTWLGKLTMIDFLGVLGRGARMGTMMGRDTVKNKMAAGDGMSFAEFTYPLLQAWDWWHMYSHHDVQIQIGGSDQYGNIVAGMDAIKYIAGSQSEETADKDIDPMKAPYGITTPLLTTSSGAKFGKSAGNAVWLDPNMTSPFDLYGFLLRTSDTDVHKYLSLFTFLPLSRIREVMTHHIANPSQRQAQHLLAREVLDLVHGTKVGKETAHQHHMLRKPTLASLTSSSGPTTSSEKSPPGETDATTSSSSSSSSTSTPANPVNIETLTLPRSLVLGIPLPRLIHSAGLAPTRSAAARLIASNGAYIGANTTWHSGQPMSDSELTFRPLSSVTPEMVEGYVAATGVLVLRVGKWKVRVVKVVEDGVFEEEEEARRGKAEVPGWKEFVDRRDGVAEAIEVVSGKKGKKAKKDGKTDVKDEKR